MARNWVVLIKIALIRAVLTKKKKKSQIRAVFVKTASIWAVLKNKKKMTLFIITLTLYTIYNIN